MRTSPDIEERLRYRILGQLHAGRLRPGDRLPSIRAAARQEGIDHRAMAQAYRALEAEGLVEVRPGSGVYLAGQSPAEGVHAETAAWLTERFVEGWRRRLGREAIGGLFERCAAVRIRCACVESNRDHMVALSAELEEDFSLEVVPGLIGEAPAAAAPDVGAADLVVSTVFHAEAARAAAARAEKPFLILTLDSDFTAEIDRRMREGPVTAVAVDPRLAARAAAYFSVTGHRDRIRYVLADRVREEGVDLADPSVLITRAARRFLGLEDYHLVPPPLRVISPASARELYRVIVAAALERAVE